jgi:hypothetical protein
MLALSMALGALLSDWICGELFMRRSTVANIGLALVANVVLFAVALLAVRLASTARATLAALRIGALLALAAVLLESGKAALGSEVPVSLVARAGSMLLVSGIVAYIVISRSENLNDRLMRAVALASIAFTASPFVLRSIAGPSIEWLSAKPQARLASATPAASPSKHGVVFLLLDELGYPAAAPFARDLTELGLNVSYQPLTAAGANTLNVIPAMFDRRGFDQARPCGRSTICSGSAWLDFSRIRAGRDDVDVTGLLHPYCDIVGLRSCYALELPHEFGNAYVSLLAFYARRLGMTLPTAWLPPPEPNGLQGKLLARQLAFVEGARFWREGGVLYAHLALPHPPGLDEISTLDRDYAANIEASRRVLKRWAKKLRAEFGDNFSLIITSDHPLRQYWCSSGVYRLADCKTRDEFRSKLVPLIIASVASPVKPGIKSNTDVFDVLNSETQRLQK